MKTEIEQNTSIAKKMFMVVGVLLLGVGGLMLGMYLPNLKDEVQIRLLEKKNTKEQAKFESVKKMVTPDEGFTLPITWGDLGPKLVKAGVIDEAKFLEVVSATEEQKNILTKGSSDEVKITTENSQFVVDLLWAIGLAQKSDVYDFGPLGTEYKDQQGDFSSTGGWTLAKGEATEYLNKFDLIPLNSDQHKKVAEIAKNVYRPCCNNPTWFPDCNHGMAALAAIEMMVSKNMSDEDIYKNILKLNSFWFPDNYLALAMYFDREGTSWDKIDSKKVLGKEYSSATGANNVSKTVGPLPGQVSGGSCGA